MTVDKNTELEYLLLQADRAGISLEDLVAHRDGGRGCPTLRDYVPTALGAFQNANTHGTLKTYLHYLADGDPNPVCICWCGACLRGNHCSSTECTATFTGLGDTPLRSITVRDIEWAHRVKKALVRREVALRLDKRALPGRAGKDLGRSTGTGAAVHVCTAARHVMKVALGDGILQSNPLATLQNPKKPSGRAARSFEPEPFERIIEELCLGGDDPELDALFIAVRLETGVRTAAPLSLKVRNLKVASCKIEFEEKRGRDIPKPISRALMDEILRHLAERADPNAGPDGPVFHYRPDKPYKHWTSSDGWEWRTGYHPMGKSRITTIIKRVQKAVPEAAEQEFRLHDLRHHVGSIVERAFGPAAASAYLGHVPDNPTAGYTRARETEVREQHKWLTGQDPADNDGQIE